MVFIWSRFHHFSIMYREGMFSRRVHFETHTQPHSQGLRRSAEVCKGFLRRASYVSSIPAQPWPWINGPVFPSHLVSKAAHKVAVGEKLTAVCLLLKMYRRWEMEKKESIKGCIGRITFSHSQGYREVGVHLGDPWGGVCQLLEVWTRES